MYTENSSTRQKMKELPKKSSLVDALCYCVFEKKAVSDVRTAWLLSTSHALWHTLDLVQVVKFLQGRTTSVWRSQLLCGVYPAGLGDCECRRNCCAVRLGLCRVAMGLSCCKVLQKKKSSLGEA